MLGWFNGMGVLGWFNGGGGVWLGGLSMLNSLHMPFYFKPRAVKEEPYPIYGCKTT